MKLFGENGTWSRIFLFLWMLLYFLMTVTNFRVEDAQKGLGFIALAVAITLLFGK